MSVLLTQVASHCRPPSPAESEPAHDLDVEVPTRLSHTRTRHRSDAVFNGFLAQPRSRHNSAFPHVATGFTHRPAPREPYSRAAAMSADARLRPTPDRRHHAPTTLQDLDRSTDLHERVAHLLTASLAPSHLSDKKLFAHSYIRRGGQENLKTH